MISEVVRKSLSTGMFIALLVAVLAASGQETQAGMPAATGVALESDLPSGQPVGTTITWSATTAGSDPTDYRLSIGLEGEPLRVMYDFSPKGTFEWAPIDEGTYTIELSARNRDTGEVTQETREFVVNSRVTNEPVVTSTDHPLVALYSAPPCQASHQMRIVFTQLGRPLDLSATNLKPCQPGHSMNFYIGGMEADSMYSMVHRIFGENGDLVEEGPVKLHQTGSLPIDFPNRIVLDSLDSETSLLDRVVLFSSVLGTEKIPAFPFATDLSGNVIWYDNTPLDLAHSSPALYRPVAGGTFLIVVADGDMRGQILREIDLAGHIVRETTAQRVSEQLVAMGQDPIGAFHHEARRLPSGHTAVIASVERILEDVQGEGPVDIYGEYVIVLDENWQVVWAWSSFDHLDVTREAVLGETCTSMGPGCPPLFLDDVANDWLHANTITYSPSDGNLLVSLRNQDWIIKIDYRDGEGTGDVIWRLGPEGDFEIESDDPSPWFTHQHDPNYVSQDQIVVYDNGNTRCETQDSDSCHSRGQVYRIDETAMTASLVLNADLNNYSHALGSAQILRNGNFHFDSGIQGEAPNFFSTADEVLPDGTKVYSLRVEMGMYRSFRMQDLYTPPPEVEVPSALAKRIYLPLMRRSSTPTLFDVVPSGSQ